MDFYYLPPEMIISASYRTDIPAFYGEWFINRLKAGYCMVENPYSNKPYHVSLRSEHVNGFIFWTKNLAPFVDRLQTVHEQGYPFIVQYTINGYPRELESRVVDAQSSVQHLRTVAETYGSRVAVWRYDTILATSLTSLDWHRNNFEQLAKGLAGATDEVVISFAQLYKKTLRNLNIAAKAHEFSWLDPSDEDKRKLTSDLVEIAKSNGMQLTVCSQESYVVHDARPARCIDAQRLSDVAKRDVKSIIKGNRPDCQCYLSRDIGAYDTCPHGCVYCYAVRERDLALTRYRSHDPQSAFLFADGSHVEPTKVEQLTLL